MENGANYVLIEGVLKTQAQQQPFRGPQLPVTKMVNHFANVWNWFVKCSWRIPRRVYLIGLISHLETTQFDFKPTQSSFTDVIPIANIQLRQ